MLIDTDVIIWFMRGNQRAASAIDRLEEFSISAVNHMELVQGMRNKHELQALRQALSNWKCAVIPIDIAISNQAMFYVEQHFHKHSIRMADALIGATAIINGLPLLTGNVRHYKMLNELKLRAFKPQ